MTIIDEILISANQLANTGKKPTVALVKAKMSQRAPLTTIITTLKNWQHQPEFIAPISEEKVSDGKKTPDNNSSALIESLLENGSVKKMIEQSLEQELTSMRKELSEMKLLIKNISEQLNQQK